MVTQRLEPYVVRYKVTCSGAEHPCFSMKPLALQDWRLDEHCSNSWKSTSSLACIPVHTPKWVPWHLRSLQSCLQGHCGPCPTPGLPHGQADPRVSHSSVHLTQRGGEGRHPPETRSPVPALQGGSFTCSSFWLTYLQENRLVFFFKKY